MTSKLSLLIIHFPKLRLLWSRSAAHTVSIFQVFLSHAALQFLLLSPTSFLLHVSSTIHTYYTVWLTPMLVASSVGCHILHVALICIILLDVAHERPILRVAFTSFADFACCIHLVF